MNPRVPLAVVAAALMMAVAPAAAAARVTVAGPSSAAPAAAALPATAAARAAIGAAGTGAAAIGAAAIGAAGTGRSPAGHPPPLHVVNLHGYLGPARPHAAAYRIAGIVRPAGRRVRAAAPALARCAEPNCDLPYLGGQVQHAPHVYLLLWGPHWSKSDPLYSYLSSFYAGLGGSPKDNWSAITSQYGDGSGHPAFGQPVLRGVFQDTSALPATVTPGDLGNEADAFATSQRLTDLPDAQIVIVAQSGTCFSDGFAGNCGTPDPAGSYCAWHAYSGTVSFTNLPYLPDAKADCGANWINQGPAGTYDGVSMTAGHEYAESATDPRLSAWYDLADSISGGEIADKCAWGGASWGGHDPEGDVTLATGTFAMQSLWSNAAGRCVMSAAADYVTITPPGRQHATLGRAVRLQVRASSHAGAALRFRATGLPAGLSISSSGLITGKPGITAGIFKTGITVHDSAVSAASAAFSWYVSSLPGPVTGFAAKCADDYSGRIRNGNKIVLWSCDGRSRQRITFTPGGELQVAGRCVTAKGVAVLESCTGSAAQTWARRASGEYVVKSDGRCLTDPRQSRANGTQLRLEVCAGLRGQRWSLPG